jgi:hypothetical protein
VNFQTAEKQKKGVLWWMSPSLVNKNLSRQIALTNTTLARKGHIEHEVEGQRHTVRFGRHDSGFKRGIF